MGSHRPLATVNPDLHVPSSLAFGSIVRCAAVGASEGDVGRVGSAAQAAVLTRAHASARRVIPGITGSIREEHYGATAV
jgi:hypothetical protein